MPGHLPYLPGSVYFITHTCWRRVKPFVEEPAIRLLLSDFDFYRRKFAYRLFAWVVMPDHYHWLIQPSEEDFQRFQWDQKTRGGKYGDDPARYYLSQIMESLGSHSAHVINQILQRQNAPLWQKGFYDRAIRTTNNMRAAINYIHQNPVTAGLAARPEDYPWSSYRAMFMGEDELLRLDALPVMRG